MQGRRSRAVEANSRTFRCGGQRPVTTIEHQTGVQCLSKPIALSGLPAGRAAGLSRRAHRCRPSDTAPTPTPPPLPSPLQVGFSTTCGPRSCQIHPTKAVTRTSNEPCARGVSWRLAGEEAEAVRAAVEFVRIQPEQNGPKRCLMNLDMTKCRSHLSVPAAGALLLIVAATAVVLAQAPAPPANPGSGEEGGRRARGGKKCPRSPEAPQREDRRRDRADSPGSGRQPGPDRVPTAAGAARQVRAGRRVPGRRCRSHVRRIQRRRADSDPTAARAWSRPRRAGQEDHRRGDLPAAGAPAGGPDPAGRAVGPPANCAGARRRHPPTQKPAPEQTADGRCATARSRWPTARGRGSTASDGSRRRRTARQGRHPAAMAAPGAGPTMPPGRGCPPAAADRQWIRGAPASPPSSRTMRAARAGAVRGVTRGYPLTFSYAAIAEAPQGRADVLDVKGEGTFALRYFINSETHLPIMVTWTTPPTNVIVTVPGQPPPKTVAPGAVVVAGPARPAGRRSEGRDGQVREGSHSRCARRRRRRPSSIGCTSRTIGTWTALRLPFRLRRAIGTETTEETTFDRFRINAKHRSAQIRGRQIRRFSSGEHECVLVVLLLVLPFSTPPSVRPGGPERHAARDRPRRERGRSCPARTSRSPASSRRTKRGRA